MIMRIGDCLESCEVFNRVLGRKIGWVHYSELLKDWKVFAENPEKYAGTVVVDMVNLWADEKLEKLKEREKILDYSDTSLYGAQAVTLDDIQ